uniref:EXPERA domain-containing protein n=1 Tax=Onchocerca volvulus TaxID=6282 RepID=A0A8R1XRP5_ONCVO
MHNQNNLSMPRWIQNWLKITTVICILDVGYTMLRPYTLRGNTLGKIYELWNIYGDVDLRYATTSDIVTMATGRLMIIEIILNIIALYLCRDYPRHAKLTTFLTSAFVFWKTLLYITMFIFPPKGSVNYMAESANIWKRIFIFWIPNSIWFFVPLAVMANLWNNLVDPKTYF